MEIFKEELTPNYNVSCFARFIEFLPINLKDSPSNVMRKA